MTSIWLKLIFYEKKREKLTSRKNAIHFIWLFFFFKCQAVLYLNEFFKNIFLLKCKQALKFWGVGEGGVAMHFDAWGAMCEIKELLVIPMIKYLKFHPHAASFCLGFPLKKQMQKMNRINSSCTQVKTERIHYSLPMFFSHLDWLISLVRYFWWLTGWEEPK